MMGKGFWVALEFSEQNGYRATVAESDGCTNGAIGRTKFCYRHRGGLQR